MNSNDDANQRTIVNNDVLKATTSLNNQVGTTNDKINVTEHQVSVTDGNKNAGTPGQTNLHLEVNVPLSQAEKLQSGDYIDIKLEIPYKASDGHEYVMSYGAINGDAKPIVIKYNGVVAGYIVPAGNLNHYAQTTIQAGQLVVATNDNTKNNSLGTSNGYYQIIFTDGVKQYLADHSGQSGDWKFKFDLTWYNALQNEDKKVTLANQFTIYTDGENGEYTPKKDLQVGDLSMASGISFKVVKVDGTNSVSLSTETRASDHTGNIPGHRWFQRGDKYYLVVDGDNTQGVGVSLSNQDSKGNSL